MASAKILIIEDDIDFALSLKLALSTKGQGADVAPTGEEGLELFASQNYAVTITDIKLPGIDGIEVVKRIKAIDQNACVFVMTGFRDQKLIDRANEAGSQGALLKPFRLADFNNMVIDAIP